MKGHLDPELSGTLYDVAPRDLATLGLAALTLILVAFLAFAVTACAHRKSIPNELFGRNKP